MSKFCLMMFSLVGSSPALVRPANSSGSLPPSQLPIFLPAMVAGLVMLAALNDAIRVPERWKIWAIETRSVPPSRDWSMFGSQAVPMSAPPVATTWTLLTFGPPSSSDDVEPGVPVVALVDRGVVPRELRLGDPLELELDGRQDGERRAAPTR